MPAAPPPKCARCLDTRWVCERHPDLPRQHDTCDHAGMPCPFCNKREPPTMPPGWQSLID